MKVYFGIFLLLSPLALSGWAQGFINLNFESANVSAYGNGPAVVPDTNGIPGWTVNGITFLPTNEIDYNTLSTGEPCVSLISTNAPNFINLGVIDGEFSIVLFNGVSISQTSLVPIDANSILFKAQGSGPFDVSLGGQIISYSALSTGSNYTLYGGSIPSFLDGQNEQLIFSVPTGQNNYWTLDDIQFSPTLVPEPDTLGLAALGGLFFVWRYRLKFSKNKA